MVIDLCLIWSDDLFYLLVCCSNICIVEIDVVCLVDGVLFGIVLCFGSDLYVYFWFNLINLGCMVDVFVSDLECLVFGVVVII